MAKAAVLTHISGDTTGGIPSEADYAAIRPYLLEAIPREALYRRRMVMANDALDRRFQVMGSEVMQRLGETLVGKSLLLGHDHEKMPVGLWYGAQLRPSSPTEPGTWSLEASFYMPRGGRSDQLIADLDAGVLRYGSLGFAYDKRICSVCQLDYYGGCPHIAGQMTEEGEQVALRWGGDLTRYESMEGSLVTLGCVRGAEIISQGFLEGDAMEGWEKVASRLEALEARLKPAPQESESLAADGQAYREHCLAELVRIGKLIGSEAEGEALAQALAGAPVARIQPVLAGYQQKLNEKFPVAPIAAAGVDPGEEQEPNRFRYLRPATV